MMTGQSVSTYMKRCTAMLWHAW